MNSSENLSITDSNRKNEGNENGSMKAPPKRLYFSPPTFKQNWSFPDTLIYYMAKNPKSPKCYQKLIRTCKYFFYKNPIIVCSDFTFVNRYNNNGEKHVPEVEIEKDGLHAYIGLENPSQKFWITDGCSIFPEYIVNKEDILSISNIIQHIYRCEAKYVLLFNQDISFNEYMFLVKNVDSLNLSRLIVKDHYGTVVPLEKLVEVAVKAKDINICIDEDADLVISSKTVKNLLKIPCFASLASFSLWGVPEAFDIDTFFAYIKENKHTEISLYFSSQLSDQYKARLDAIIDEILSADTHEYKAPYITL